MVWFFFRVYKNSRLNWDANSWQDMLSDDTVSFRHLPRRSSKNCDLQFANGDRFKANYSVDYISLNYFQWQLSHENSTTHMEWRRWSRWLWTVVTAPWTLGLSTQTQPLDQPWWSRLRRNTSRTWWQKTDTYEGGMYLCAYSVRRVLRPVQKHSIV